MEWESQLSALTQMFVRTVSRGHRAAVVFPRGPSADSGDDRHSRCHSEVDRSRGVDVSYRRAENGS